MPTNVGLYGSSEGYIVRTGYKYMGLNLMETETKRPSVVSMEAT